MKKFISPVWNRIGVALVTLALTACATPSTTSPQNQTAAQPNCETVEYVEDLNRGALKRVAHIKGENSIVFIALDPIWSAPEYQYEGRYTADEHFENAKKIEERHASTVSRRKSIDEVVVWRLLLSEAAMGAAVAFKEGCVGQWVWRT